VGQIFLALSYYSQRAVFASPLNAFFITTVVLVCRCSNRFAISLGEQ